MNEQWQKFLQQNGASFENDMVSDFSDVNFDFGNIQQETILVDLSHRGLLKVSGTDAQAFLQGQFCNDVHAVDATHSQLSAYCTPKGRILASFRLSSKENDYFMSMPGDVVDTSLKRLRMFVMRSQVVFEDLSQEWVQIGISGPNATGLVENIIGTVPTKANQVTTKDNISCAKTDYNLSRFELHGPITEMEAVWNTLASSCQKVASHFWTWLDIQAGIPSITTPVVEAFVPQMVNLHWIEGLSFKKGCYPGQEIVARTHYLGKLKRRMYLAHIDGTDHPAAGDDVYRLSDPQGQGAGKIVLCHPAPQGGCDLLVVMQIEAVESDQIIANRDASKILTFSELPYTVETKAE